MVGKLIKSALFLNMSEADIAQCLDCSDAVYKNLKKNEVVFNHWDKPSFLYVLVEGSIVICKDSSVGRRGIITTIERAGDMFGEVFLFMEHDQYDYYALATKESIVLQIPKSFFYQSCSKNCNHHSHLIHNMLSILAQKAYYLNQKLQLLSSGTLRQKIAKYLLDQKDESNCVKLHMTREEFADFLHVARPSLSRELTKMQEEGLIQVKGKLFQILDEEKLEFE